MPGEEEKRLHRCCFSGHRPEKLHSDEETVKQWLEEKIDEAIRDGYVTFISGCAMGVDIWAGQIVLKKRAENAGIHLIAAVPWPGFAKRWKQEWRDQYDDLLKGADLVVNISKNYQDEIFRKRNEWMVNHASRLIAYYNGEDGGTKDTVDFAESKGIETVVKADG